MSFGGGNSGSGSIHTSTDVALNNPIDGQVLAYDSALDKWKNASSVGGRLSVSMIVYQRSGNSIAVAKDGTVTATAATTAANNVTVIQAAIDALATTTTTLGAGGVIYIDGGVWDLSAPLNLKYGVSLQGQLGSWHDDWVGANLFGTVLRPTSAVGANAVVQCGVAASGSRLSTNPHGSWIASLAIDGSNNTAGSGIYWLDCSYSRTQNVFIRNFSGGSGIRFTGNIAQSGGPTTGSSLDNTVYDCTIASCGYGIKVDGVDSTDGAIRDCRIMTAGINSISISGGGWQVSGGHFTNNTNAPHLNINAGLFLCSGCYFDSGTGYIAVIASSLATITNCTFTPSITSNANAVVQIAFGKVTITDNSFLIQPGTSASVKGAIELPSSATTGLVRNNIVRNLAGTTVFPVVSQTGAAFANTTTSSMYVGENLQWTT